MVKEARLEARPEGVVPSGDGWFVLNAREASWVHHPELGSAVTFEGDARFAQYGVNIHVLQPGVPNCMYHGEEDQEDFLVLAGECLLLVEGEERRLRRWDFVHCPPWTEHVFVGAGEGPCAILMVGGRAGTRVLYPASELARGHGAAVVEETTSPAEAYARFSEERRGPYREGDLP